MLSVPDLNPYILHDIRGADFIPVIKEEFHLRLVG